MPDKQLVDTEKTMLDTELTQKQFEVPLVTKCKLLSVHEKPAPPGWDQLTDKEVYEIHGNVLRLQTLNVIDEKAARAAISKIKTWYWDKQ